MFLTIQLALFAVNRAQISTYKTLVTHNTSHSGCVRAMCGHGGGGCMRMLAAALC